MVVTGSEFEIHDINTSKPVWNIGKARFQSNCALNNVCQRNRG